MSRFERFIVTACPWLFGSICIVAGLLVAATGKPEARTLWVIMICSGFILMTLYGITTVLLQLLKAIENQNKKPEEDES